MTTAVADRGLAVGRTAPGDGGRPARKAVIRWAWRMFRREWRGQALVLALLIVAVAGTTFGLGVVSNVSELKADPQFGTANTILSLTGSDPNLGADLAAIQHNFHPVDVVAHQTVPIPGSIGNFDLRAEDPHGFYARVTVRLDQGRYPSGAGEVAVTRDVAQTFGLSLGRTWTVDGRQLRVVGLVENPLELSDAFGLVAPGQVASPTNVAILLNASQSALEGFRLPSHTGLNTMSRGNSGATAAEVLVLLMGTIGLLFVGLLAVAGFTVLAQRRLRALGMLGALGATDRHIRLVMKANGAAVGFTAAVVGAAVGLATWFAFTPTLQSLTSHRIDPLAIPWWGVTGAMALALVTAVAAAWWPARAMSRLSVVAALSGRPPQPRPAHRLAATGGLLMAGGLILLAFADTNRAAFIICGTLTTSVGLLLFAPLATSWLGRVGGHTSIAARLALRDLARYQGRSGAALGAITLALAISATIAVSAAAAQTPTGPGTLARNQLMVHVSPGDAGNPVTPLSPAALAIAQSEVDQIAGILGARSVLPLEQAYNAQAQLQAPPPGAPNGAAGYPPVVWADVILHSGGGMEVTTMINLYLATPAVLAHYGISLSAVSPTADIITSQTSYGTFQLFDPAFVKLGQAARKPVVQIDRRLPSYTSAPVALLTSHALHEFGWTPLASGWLIQAPKDLTSQQIRAARQRAAASGLYIETRRGPKSLAQLRDWATIAGILLALAVLAMTVGLIRSETGRDLRTLSATGASSHTRRALTAVTAGALALLGAVLGTGGAYGALLAWHRSDLHPLTRVPVTNLLLILVGLPLLATAGGWLLAGRQPPSIARQPLE